MSAQKTENRSSESLFVKKRQLEKIIVNKPAISNDDQAVQSNNASSTRIFQIYVHNLSGAKSKISKLNHFLATTSHDLILLQETWYTNIITDAEIVANTNFTIIRADRSEFVNKRTLGGGVAVCLQSNIEYEKIEMADKTHLEYLIVRVKLASKFIVIMNVYLPPYKVRDFNVMNTEFDLICRNIRLKFPNDPFTAIGDFNMGKIEWVYLNDETEENRLVATGRMQPHERLFAEKARTNGLHQINELVNSIGKIIDLVLVTDPSVFTTRYLSDAEIFDRPTLSHVPFSVSVVVTDTAVGSEPIRKKRNIKLRQSKMDLGRFNFHLIGDYEYDTADTHNKLVAISSAIANIERANTTYCRSAQPVEISSHPWTNDSAYKQLIRRRHRAKTIYTRQPTPINKTHLDDANIALREKYGELRQNYYSRLVTNMTGSSREFYAIMSSKKKCKSTLPPMMTYEDIKYYGYQRIQMLGKHLFSCFTDIGTRFSDSFEEFDSQLNDIYRLNYESMHDDLWQDYCNFFSLDEVNNAMNKIDLKTDAGPMDISAKFIKYNQNILAPVLCNAYNAIMRTGVIPESWKESFLVPIPKKGRVTEVTNFRGIAIQSIIPKIFDRILTEKIYKHFEPLIPASQHGFVKKRSTTTNLIEASTFIQNGMRSGGQVDVVYFDFSKAFDRLNHQVLAKKLAKYGFPYCLFRAILAFVTNRKLILRDEGKPTDIAHITRSAVPQGSHLGPLIFVIFCADIASCIRDLPVKLLSFADDTKFLAHVNSEYERRILQTAIDNLVNWSVENHMDLNHLKTYHVSYTNNGRQKYNSYYHIGLNRIAISEETRDLGIIFDKRLQFKKHIANTMTKARIALNIGIRFCRDVGTPTIMKKILTCYVTPIIEYGCIIWHERQITEERKLEQFIKIATRIALGRPRSILHPRYMPFIERRRQLNLRTYEQRRKITCAIFAKKVCNGDISSPTITEEVHNSWNHNSQRRTVRNFFNIQRQLARRNPLHTVMRTSNALKEYFTIEESIEVTKRKLNEHFEST